IAREFEVGCEQIRCDQGERPPARDASPCSRPAHSGSVTAALRAGHLAVQEIVDKREGLVSLVLEHEVASGGKMELEVLQVSLIGMRTGLGENEIVLAPDNERWRLLLAEPSLHFGI